jgi:hypothetical protein
MASNSFSVALPKDETLREKILRIIQGSRKARSEALSPENEKSLGFPYIAGYMTSALDQIEDLILNS